MPTVQLIFRTGLVLLAFAAVVATSPVLAVVETTKSEAGTTVDGMTVTVTFTLGSPCSPYTIQWGDGEKTQQEADQDMACIQVTQELALQHTYTKAGTYDITLNYGGTTETRTVSVTVPVGTNTFTLEDVQSVTSRWVDPDEMMIDEEYTVYTVTLNDGSTVEINGGGFTTEEWRRQQFVDAGYTGDIDALIALAEAKDVASQPEESKTSWFIKMQERIIELLTKLFPYCIGSGLA